MNRNQGFWIVMLAWLALGWMHSPLSAIFTDDKEIYKYVGWIITKGKVPYLDVFDHKPPLIYFLNYWGLLLGNWGLWLIDMLLTGGASLLFFKACLFRRISPAWILPVLFNLLLRHSLVSFGIGLPKEYTAIFMLMAFSIIVLRPRATFFMFGILAGLSLFMQQDSIIILIPLIIYGILKERIPVSMKMFKLLAALTVGFLAVLLPLLIYFSFHHGLQDFWQDAFAFNMQKIDRERSFWDHIKIIKTTLHNTEFEISFYVSALLGLVSIRKKGIDLALLLACITSLVLSFVAEFISGRLAISASFAYYLLPLAATVPVLLFAVFACSTSANKWPKHDLLFLSVLIALPLIWAAIRFASNPSGPDGIAYGQGRLYFKYLDINKPKDYELFVFDNSNLVYAYNHYHTLAPTKWIYHYFWSWYPDWDGDNSILSSITKDLETHHTKYIIDYSKSDSVFSGKKSANEFWNAYLNQNYLPALKENQTSVLWIRKQ